MLKKAFALCLFFPLLTGCTMSNVTEHQTSDSGETTQTSNQIIRTSQSTEVAINTSTTQEYSATTQLESTEIYHGETLEEVTDESIPKETTTSSMEQSTSEAATPSVLTQTEAVHLVSQEFKDQTDLVYMIWSEDEAEYLVKVMSKSIMDQGGSGTVGFYSVNKTTSELKLVTF